MKLNTAKEIMSSDSLINSTRMIAKQDARSISAFINMERRGSRSAKIPEGIASNKKGALCTI
ncbi:hypothetical protein GCM10027287_44800 [Bordetella muralis]